MKVGDLVLNSYAGEDYTNIVGIIIQVESEHRLTSPPIAEIMIEAGEFERHYVDELEMINESR